MDAPQHRMVREVSFADTDASGWMHFANVFRYAEEAEHEFLRSRGLVVIDPTRGGWPRVKAGCDYLRPMRAGDRIEVRLGIARMGDSSICWSFEVVTDQGETAASGEMVTVRVDGGGKPVAISDNEREALQGRE